MGFAAWFGGCALAASLCTPLAALAGDDFSCPPASAPPLHLSYTKRAVTETQELTIVALGSSSTAGAAASSASHRYPAVLQAELEKALPNLHVVVLNRGISGQDAAEMVPRIGLDVVAVRPSLVVWQVGANWALRRLSPPVFKALVMTGVRLLTGAGVDVILMDNQRSPKVQDSPGHARIDLALASIARSSAAQLFPRGELMDEWQQAGYPYELFVSGDGLHHNDRGYACVARALAAAIVAGLNSGVGNEGPQSVTARR